MSVPASQAIPNDLSAQYATNTTQPATWAQIQQLLTPPPLPSQDASKAVTPPPASPPAAASTDTPAPPSSDTSTDQGGEDDQPPASAAGSATGSSGQPPLTPDQQAQVVADLMSQRGADSAAEQQYLQDLSESEEEDKKLTDAEVATLSEQPPSAPQPEANPLQRMAPLLFLSAFGGMATKQDAGLMLAATTGTVQGYLKGDQQLYDNSVKQYDQAYQQFKDRQQQQLKIYDTLREAYKERPDADLKALQMARDMTGDESKIDQQLLEIQQHYDTAASQLAKTNEQMADKKWYERAQLKLRQQALAAQAQGAQGGNLTDEDLRTLADTAIKTGHDPAFGMGKSATRDRYNAIKAQQIHSMGGSSAAVSAGIQTKVQLQAQKAFTTGRQGDTVRSFNVLVNHLDTLQHLMDALNNGDVRAVNLAANEVGRQLGVAAPTNFDAARRVVSDEITKAVTGSAGALGDRQELQKNLSMGNSPSAMSGVIDTYKDLAGGQLYGLQQQYEAGTKSDSFSSDLRLSPAAQALLQRATETSKTKQAAGQAVTATGPNGQKLILQNGRWVPAGG